VIHVRGILLGFEVETGKPIYLPLHHTAFTGMTQKAGKTTAIEAAAMRSGLRAVTFRTKRGEVGFETTGKEIEPYFRERSDWRYVESLIEATLTESQRFNRSWIIRACEGTKTLSEVWNNIKEAKKKARGLALSVYTNLDAYLKIVIPEIRKYHFSKTLNIAKSGVSVMNLIGMPTEVQALVIRSVIDYIYEHERNIIVVIPEAWKFIGLTHTPVTYAAERLIREGASVKIYLFLDSQDISGINPRIRAQIDNWILGRQKYEHEIERTLKAIPIRNKPKKEQIQTLKLGHFYAACDIWCRQIYFLPWQIPEKIGIQVAKGELKPEYVKKMLDERREKFRKKGNDLVWKEKYDELKTEYEKLKKNYQGLQDKIKELEQKIPDKAEIENLKKQLERKDEELTKTKRKLIRFQWFEDAIKDTVKDMISSQISSEGSVLGLQSTITIVDVPKKVKQVTISDETVRGKILTLAKEGFFKTWRPLREVVKELEEHRWTPNYETVKKELLNMAKDGLLANKKLHRENVYALPPNIQFVKKEG